MTGKICLITGGTSGIGRAAASALAAQGAIILFTGRDAARGKSVEQELQRHHPSAGAEFFQTDLSDFDGVRALAATVKEKHGHVDVLINNAGARFDTFQQNSREIEMTFAANHLGHFLLTGLLLDSLRSAPAAQVITVGSVAHRAARAEVDWCQSEANYDRKQAYAKSKLANIMFAYELSERLRASTVTANAVDPGVVATNFARNNGLVSWMKHLLAHTLKRDLVSARTGADTIVWLADAPPEVAGCTGQYFYERKAVASAPQSYDPKARRELWELSERLTEFTAMSAGSTEP